MKRLMCTDPEGRPVATEALQHPWLAGGWCKDDWYERLTGEFLSLGVELGLGEGGNETDIIQLLAIFSKEAFSDLVQQAAAKGLYSVLLIMLKLLASRTITKSKKAKIFQKVVESGRIDMVKL